ncbi:HPr kinase/phosphorylase [Bacillus sp. NRRL B-14911]|nr:HPr kinase/phosphorylase [Bacillus sp. NRRL B-14911]OXT16737.1 serine kinase [Bacillus sp. OG2]
MGSFLISITVDRLGSTGNFIMHAMGVAINLFAVFYIWKRKPKLEGKDDKK